MRPRRRGTLSRFGAVPCLLIGAISVSDASELPCGYVQFHFMLEPERPLVWRGDPPFEWLAAENYLIEQRAGVICDSAALGTDCLAHARTFCQAVMKMEEVGAGVFQRSVTGSDVKPTYGYTIRCTHERLEQTVVEASCG